MQPIKVLEVTLRVLNRLGRIRRARLLVTGNNNRRVQRCQPLQVRDPIPAALRCGVPDLHTALVVHYVACNNQPDGWNIERGRVGAVRATLLDDAQLVAFKRECVLPIGLR